MVSYVNVDYDFLDEIIKKRGTNRSKCAEACGISPGTIGNSFLRKSKMRLDRLKAIADFLRVQPVDLIPKDEWGNPRSYNDYDAVTSKSLLSQTDKEMNEIMASSMLDLYIDLNYEGRDILYTVSREISDLLHQIPKYLIDAPEMEEHTDGQS